MSTDFNLNVLTGISFEQSLVNTSDEELLNHIKHSIRLGFPQVRPQPLQYDRVCIVGGGPSLNNPTVFEELRQLYFQGAKVIALNNAAQWLLDRNIRPSAQIILDARASNARFVEKEIPQCRYLLASQCHPDVWAQMEGRDAWIWHALSEEDAAQAVREVYGENNFMSIGHGPVGGTTVLVRAVALLRTIGFVRFDIFGADSCILDGESHHAYAQPENDTDRILSIRVKNEDTGSSRMFRCAPWHIKQLEDFIRMIRVSGDDYVLHVHGDGLLAYALTSSAELQLTKE